MAVLLMKQYVIDTCSIIDGHSDGNMRRLLEHLIKAGRLKMPPGVMGELEVGSDYASAWAKSWESLLVQELSAGALARLDDLVRRYGRPFRDPENPGKIYRGLIKKGTSNDADPEVVALAVEHGWTVVSEEASGIKGACKCEKIECVSLRRLANNEGQKQGKQLPLV